MNKLFRPSASVRRFGEPLRVLAAGVVRIQKGLHSTVRLA